MADEVVAPAVRVLDNGYQAPNAVDYARLGLAMGQPMNEAIQQGNANRNALMMEQFRGAQEMASERLQNSQIMQRNAQMFGYNKQLAEAQQKMFLEREAMRDQRVIEYGKQRNQAMLEGFRERLAGTMVNSRAEYLVNHLGGDLPSGDPFSPDYLSKVNQAIADRKKDVTWQDAKALASIQLRRDAASKQYSSIIQEANSAVAATQGVYTQKALEDGASANGFGTDAKGIEDYKKAAQSDPDIASDFRNRLASFKSQAVEGWFKDHGKPEYSAALANYTTQMRTLDAQERQVSTMPGPRGAVPKPWLSEAQNLAQDDDWVKTNAPDIYNARKGIQPGGQSPSPSGTEGKPGTAGQSGVSAPATVAPPVSVTPNPVTGGFVPGGGAFFSGHGAGGGWGTGNGNAGGAIVPVQPTAQGQINPVTGQPPQLINLMDPSQYTTNGLFGAIGSNLNVINGELSGRYDNKAVDPNAQIAAAYRNSTIQGQPAGQYLFGNPATAAGAFLFGTPSGPLPMPARQVNPISLPANAQPVPATGSAAPMVVQPQPIAPPNLPNYQGAVMSPMAGNFQPINGYGAASDAQADAIGEGISRMQYMNAMSGGGMQPIYMQ